MRPRCLQIILFLFAFQLWSGNLRLLENIRYYAYPEYTRVVLDLSAPLSIREKVLQETERARLFFDLPGCRFSTRFPAEKKKEIKLATGNLLQIRLGQLSRETVRVVFDFDRIGKYTRFYLTSPFRIVFDIYFSEEYIPRSREYQETTQQNPTGKPSIARQLGLGVHRIIIDPGHGGKDPGAINRSLHLQEKEITLDIAKRLLAILSEHPELEIILTRDRDEYLSLEERTAIANSQNGDLFISIHTNSARRQSARGIETFFLSLTTDPGAMAVAAQENAMSTKSIAEMKSILEQILKSSNIAESRIFANCLQDNMVGHLQKKFRRIGNLGVKKAPFYVLLGAQMPSSLAEVSFISYPEDARRLATPDYRQAIASGLYLGIQKFVHELNSR